MSGATNFVQSCPTCGRRLEVKIEYLGRIVECRHCRGRFEATDSTNLEATDSDSGLALLNRADRLLSPEAWPRPR